MARWTRVCGHAHGWESTCPRVRVTGPGCSLVRAVASSASIKRGDVGWASASGIGQTCDVLLGDGVRLDGEAWLVEAVGVAGSEYVGDHTDLGDLVDCDHGSRGREGRSATERTSPTMITPDRAKFWNMIGRVRRA